MDGDLTFRYRDAPNGTLGVLKGQRGAVIENVSSFHVVHEDEMMSHRLRLRGRVVFA
jgi:hypothetical protein